MRSTLVIPGLLAIALVMPVSTTLADPPPHAPAHGYRAKGARHSVTGPHAPGPVPVAVPRDGVQVIFDSERGVYVGIGLPDLFFHDGTYYRQREGRWQASATGDGGWRRRAAFRVPDPIVAAAKRSMDQPAPAAISQDR